MANVNKLLDQVYQKNSRNYEEYNKYRNLPVIGWTFGYQADKMQYEENQRYWADFEKNTGVSVSNFKYPIRAGLYNYSGYYGNAVNASYRSIFNLYKKVSYKKPEINIHNHRQIHNHGDYYRYGDFNNNNYYR